LDRPIKNGHRVTDKEKAALPLLIEGRPQREIAEKTGMCQSTVSAIKNKDGIRELIEQAQQKIIDKGLDQVINNQLRKIALGKTILSKKHSEDNIITHEIPTIEDKTLLELADKAENRLMQSVGLAPSYSQSNAFLQIINNNQAVLSPEVLDLLRVASGDVIDVELGFEGDMLND